MTALSHTTTVTEECHVKYISALVALTAAEFVTLTQLNCMYLTVHSTGWQQSRL